MIGIAATVLIAYGAIAALAFMFQERLIYLPAKMDLETLRTVATRGGFSLWPGADAGYRALMASPASDETRGTVVVFHGNAGSALDRTYYIRVLTGLGYRVLLAEYPGYGARPGTPREQSIIGDARETIRLAIEQFGAPLYIAGESLGAGVAAAVASAGAVADGLVLITPWDTLANLAQSAYWFLPTRLILKERYDSVKSLKGYTGPVAVVMAARDEIVPTELTRRLFDSLTGPKRLFTLPGVGHNDWPRVAGAPLWSEVFGFIQASAGKAREAPSALPSVELAALSKARFLSKAEAPIRHRGDGLSVVPRPIRVRVSTGWCVSPSTPIGAAAAGSSSASRCTC